MSYCKDCTEPDGAGGGGDCLRCRVNAGDQEWSEHHAAVRSILRHHGIDNVHTALVADLIYALIKEPPCPPTSGAPPSTTP